MRPAVILGARFPAVALIQSLSPRGVPCWVASSRPHQAAWSRYARWRRLPSISSHEENAVHALELWLAGFGERPVIFPAGDAEALTLARHRDRLGAVADVCVAGLEAVEVVLDKTRFYAWAEGERLSSPRAVPVGSGQAPLPFPFIVKPRNFSLLVAGDVRGAGGVKPSRYKLRKILNEPDWARFRSEQAGNLERFLAQALVEGGPEERFSIGVAADEQGAPTAVFVGRVLRTWPVGHGNTMLGQNDEVPDEVLVEVEAVSRNLRLRGIAEYEYRRDPCTGRFHLIEVNPRAWTWLQASRGTSADIAFSAYLYTCGDAAAAAVLNGPPGRVRAVRAIADLTNLWLRYPRGHPDRNPSPGRWLRSIRGDTTLIIETDRRDWSLALACAAFQAVDLVRGEG